LKQKDAKKLQTLGKRNSEKRICFACFRKKRKAHFQAKMAYEKNRNELKGEKRPKEVKEKRKFD
jgi:hypothetical protein